MENTVKELVEEIDLRRSKPKPTNWYKTWWFILAMILLIVALIVSALSYYQANHFNSQIKINGIHVSGMSAEKALNKLKTSELKNIVYVGQQQILDGKDTKMAFTDKDLPGIKKLLKNQRTFFPSSKPKNYSLLPNKLDQYRSQELKKQLEEKLLSMNKNLKSPEDAKVTLEDGKIVVSTSAIGQQYDIESLIKDYEKHEYTSDIHLNPVYIQPIKEDSPAVKSQEDKLQAFLQQTVEYKVQDKIYTLKASDLFKNATVSEDLKVTFDPGDHIKKKIEEINSTQATLGKNFNFKTHSGKVVTVKGRGYGWELDVEKEGKQIQEAFEKGVKSVTASNISGNGWNGEGYGFDTTNNNGIGDTYAEVSLAEQRIWVYREGKLVVTTNVVTGTLSTHNGTSRGVWYILYKKSPSVLTGREVGGKPSYTVDVNYWAPFTNDGQGFHDASWRSNWASNAYIAAGSHGCVNTPPSMMKKVYDNLSTYEPVVVY